MQVGRGIFMWNGPERQTARYGLFYLHSENFDGDYTLKPTTDLTLLESLFGKRVKFYAKVVEARKSGHAGDGFLKIYPSIPEVNEIVQLGVGLLHIEADIHSPFKRIFGTRPSIPRTEYWSDPRPWYRLHDQTVELFVEETNEIDSPNVSALYANCGEGSMSNGDGTFQIRKKGLQPGQMLKTYPKFTNLGDGTFLVEPPSAHGNAGEIFEIE